MTRSLIARPLAVLAGAAILVAACGSPAATAAPTTAAAATQAPTVTTPAATVGPGFSFVLPSGFNADQELEGLLPDDIAGQPVQKLSMAGTSFLGTGEDSSKEMLALLAQLGKTPADLSVAFGSAGTDAVIIAFRIKGVNANDALNALVTLSQNPDIGEMTDVSVAGKSAKKLVSAEEGDTYLYFSGDVIFTIAGDISEPVLNEIFSKLP